MLTIIVATAKGLGQLIDLHFASYDRETGNLMGALAAFIERHGKE